jgi:hypothetical protein
MRDPVKPLLGWPAQQHTSYLPHDEPHEHPSNNCVPENETSASRWSAN